MLNLSRMAYLEDKEAMEHHAVRKYLNLKSIRIFNSGSQRGVLVECDAIPHPTGVCKGVIAAIRGRVDQMETDFHALWQGDKEFVNIEGKHVGVSGKGFIDAYDTIKTSGMIAEGLDSANKNPAGGLFITGHDVGGTVATLAAADIDSCESFKGLLVRAVTFGAVKPFNEETAVKVTARPFELYRCVNRGDGVPALPSSTSDPQFCHAGMPVYFHKNVVDGQFGVYGNLNFDGSGETGGATNARVTEKRHRFFTGEGDGYCNKLMEVIKVRELGKHFLEICVQKRRMRKRMTPAEREIERKRNTLARVVDAIRLVSANHDRKIMMKELVYFYFTAAISASVYYDTVGDVSNSLTSFGLTGEFQIENLKLYRAETQVALVCTCRHIPHPNKDLHATIIAFRGTDDASDALIDLECVFTTNFTNDLGYAIGRGARGFNKAYELLRTTPLLRDALALSASTPDGIICTGHSLGGALSTLCYVDLHSLDACKDIKLRQVTFGAPRTLNNATALTSHNVGSEFYRCVNQGDPVCRAPPEILDTIVGLGKGLNYSHAGISVFFENSERPDSKGSFKVIDAINFAGVSDDDSFYNRVDVNAHRMVASEGYMPSIKRQAEALTGDKWETIVKNRSEPSYIHAVRQMHVRVAAEARKLKFSYPSLKRSSTTNDRKGSTDPTTKKVRSSGSLHIESRLSLWETISTINKTV